MLAVHRPQHKQGLYRAVMQSIEAHGRGQALFCAVVWAQRTSAFQRNCDDERIWQGLQLSNQLDAGSVPEIGA